MSAAAAAAAMPGAKTRRKENWVKNMFYSRVRNTRKDGDDVMWAPLYAYQAACAAAGGERVLLEY